MLPVQGPPDDVELLPLHPHLSVEPFPPPPFRYRLSAQSVSILGFCVLNCATAFLFSALMKSEIATFRIPAVVHHWDLEVKAEACRRAGLLYLAIAALVLLLPYIQRSPLARLCCRAGHGMKTRCTRMVPKSYRPLLGYHRKESDYSDEEMSAI